MKLSSPQRFTWAVLAGAVALGSALPFAATANVSARMVLKSEQGWRLPALGEDISNAVFYPSWFVGIGGGETSLRDHSDCNHKAVTIGNHFTPSWQWHVSAGKCQVDDIPADDYSLYKLRLEHLFANVESPLNAFFGLGVLGRDHQSQLPFDEAQDAAPSVNVGAHLRGGGRWTLRADHTESTESFRQSTLTLIAYLGGQQSSDIPPSDILIGDSSTVDSAKYLADAPAEPQDAPVEESIDPETDYRVKIATVGSDAVVTDSPQHVVEPADSAVVVDSSDEELVLASNTPVTDTAKEIESAGNAAVVESEIEEIELIASADSVDATPSVNEAAANVCPPLARPMKSLAFSADGSLDAASVSQLRALAGTLARRDNLIARVALPERAGSAVAVESVVSIMVAAEPAIAGRVVANVVPNLPVAVFETYRVAVSC